MKFKLNEKQTLDKMFLQLSFLLFTNFSHIQLTTSSNK
jgi:hypothetical protein